MPILAHFFFGLSLTCSSIYAFLFCPLSLESANPINSLDRAHSWVSACFLCLFLTVLPILNVGWLYILPLMFGVPAVIGIRYYFSWYRYQPTSVQTFNPRLFVWLVLNIMTVNFVFANGIDIEKAIGYAPLFVLSCFIALHWPLVYVEKLKGWEEEIPLVLGVHERRKALEFAFGLFGSALFQYLFKQTSKDLVLAFLCFTVSWLGSLAVVQPASDLGIFNFLLANACLGWAVNVFKLRGYTWFVTFACVFLFWLRPKVVSVKLTYDQTSLPVWNPTP